MRKEQLERAVELTRECLEQYWQGDASLILSHCAEDIVWIAAAQGQYLEGLEAVRQDCAATLPDLQRCRLLGQEFTAAQNLGSVCTVAGRYLVTTDETMPYFLQVQQRCTFVWELQKGELLLRHVHVSNPLGELKTDEGSNVVGQLGPMAQQYLLRHYQEQLEARRVMILDRKEGVIHFLAPVEILYAAANRRWCTIHTVKEEVIPARMSITDFAHAVGEGFVSVHRSYVLNVAYITLVRPYCAVLENGEEIPIPVKKLREVRESLSARYGTPWAEK